RCLLAEDQAWAHIAGGDCRLGAWAGGYRQSVGGGAAGKPAALCRQRADGIYASAAQRFTALAGIPRAFAAGGGLPAPGGVGATGTVLPGAFFGVDAGGALAGCQLPGIVLNEAEAAACWLEHSRTDRLCRPVLSRRAWPTLC